MANLLPGPNDCTILFMLGNCSYVRDISINDDNCEFVQIDDVCDTPSIQYCDLVWTYSLRQL